MHKNNHGGVSQEEHKKIHGIRLQDEQLERERKIRERMEKYDYKLRREQEQIRRERELRERQRIEEMERREEERLRQEEIERNLYLYEDNNGDGYDDDGFWH